MKRENILTGSPWEDKMGYCRAVRIGNIIEVSGTVAIVDGEKVKADDAYAQTYNILERVEKVLQDLNVGMKDVIRTRILQLISILLKKWPEHMLLFLKMLNLQPVFMKSVNWLLRNIWLKLNLQLSYSKKVATNYTN